jgi:CubicO group peptidase (beta-lactamase class C family)
MNYRRTALLALYVLLLGPFAFSANAQSSNAVEAGRVDSLLAPFDRLDRPGAAVLVFRGDETLFSRGYGSANLEYDIPIGTGTVFHVASVSKQFTAFALAVLEARGKLSLEDDVRKHIPELADFGHRVTLRHLLNHTSGIRDQWNLWVLAGGRMDDVIRQDDLFRLVERQRELNFSPGAEHLYSNSGYLLAAKVVERVTGQSFGDWLSENVFQPLGMVNTQVYDDHERIVRGRAYSYRQEGGAYRKAVLSYANSSATSLFTTTEDLNHWLRNLGNGRVGGAEVAGAMRVRGVLASGDTISYALGVTVERHRGLEMIQHGGADAGFRSFVAYYPEIDAGVIVLSNLAQFNPSRIARQVAEIFFEADMHPPVASPTTASSGTNLSRAALDRLAGDWHVEGDASGLRFEREGDRLVVQTPQFGRLSLLVISDSVFQAEEIGARILFHRDGQDVKRATVEMANGSRLGLVRESNLPGLADLEAYTGRFYSSELETFYTVVLAGDRLVARHRRHGDIVLRPDRRDGFAGDQWFFGDVVFERGEDGVVTQMRVSSGRVRNLMFERIE